MEMVLLWEAVVAGERYAGGSKKYIMLKEGLGTEEVQRMVSEVTSHDLTVQKLWYSLRYGRGMVIEVEGNADVRMFLKENDEHSNLYTGKSGGPKRRTQKVHYTKREGVAVIMASFVEEAGGMGMMWYKRVVRDQGEIIELSDDDEIFIALEDVGEDEAMAGEGKEGSKGRGLMKGKLADTYKKMGCIATVKCYYLMLGEYSVELTNSHYNPISHIQPAGAPDEDTRHGNS
ncbi:LOW QUALITY PROTEIN: hypothetical protein Cgig2_003185 [Carnegiea gigantea]|uniref:Uncharacterized protein n=1 Tax=Carnegiea gigantea TaxID=171969 RepID=A0A9Q1JG75_9CARY|nr:LOW QUALITY PROTEIN: hypothetical protein Cgig2_003185 [Carnegiea gigantea]